MSIVSDIFAARLTANVDAQYTFGGDMVSTGITNPKVHAEVGSLPRKSRLSFAITGRKNKALVAANDAKLAVKKAA